MVTIGVNQSLSNIEMYEHSFILNTKKLYKSDETFYDQQHHKAIIE